MTDPLNWTDRIRFQDDCEASAKFGHALWELERDDPPPYQQIIHLMRSVAPDPFMNASSSSIVAWVDTWNETFDSLFDRVLNVCLLEFCQQAPWEGNPDLVGIGVITAYFIEMALATVFLAFFAYQHTVHKEKLNIRAKSESRRTKSTPCRNIFAALQTSFGLFWDSAFLFSVAVALSVLVTVSFGNANYDLSFGMVSSNLTWAVTWLTWPSYLPLCRHKRARWIALCLASVLQCYVAWICTIRKKKDSVVFERFCLFQSGYYSLAENILVGTAALGTAFVTGLFPLCYLMSCLVALVRKARKSGISSSLWQEWPETTGFSRCRWPFKALWYTLVIVIMSANMGTMIRLRSEASLMAGPSNSENIWSFGQAMALATWVPTFLDFFLVVKGHLTALNYRLPIGLEIRLSTEEEHEDTDDSLSET